jgi:DNA polymerase
MEQRGVMQRLPEGPRAFATVHPSWVLRQRGSDAREEAWRNFLDDLRLLKRRRR